MTWLNLATHAEERDHYTPSYRARIDAAWPLDGDEQRVRLADGSELTATVERRWGYRWLDEDGAELEVVAVEIRP